MVAADPPFLTDYVDPKGSAGFTTDPSGQTLFYPNGPQWGGYVVPPAAIRNLRAAAKLRVESISRYGILIGLLLSIPALIVFFWMGPAHPLIAVGACLIGSLLYRMWAPWWRLRLASGLQPVGGSQRASHRVVLLVVGGVALTVSLIRLVLSAYDGRIAELSLEATEVTFYSGIAWPLAVTLLFGGFAALGMVAYREIAEERGDDRAAFLIFGALAFATGGAIWAMALYSKPTPKIVLDDGGFHCGWTVSWRNIDGMWTQRGWRLREDIVLKITSEGLQSGQWSDYIRKRGAVNCEISDLNREYHEVFDTVRDVLLATLASAPTSRGITTISAPRTPYMTARSWPGVRRDLNELPLTSSGDRSEWIRARR